MCCKVLTNIFRVLFIYMLLWSPILNVHAQMGKLFDADKQMSSSYTTQIYRETDSSG